MNSFFYNLGKRTANTQHAIAQGTGNAYDATCDALKSFAAGYSEQSEVNHVPAVPAAA